MIENSTTKTAEMALRLNAINRWCVTGTPIGKTLSDIQGLLHFLQVIRNYLLGGSIILELSLQDIRD